VRQGRDLREQLRRHGLARDEQLGRLEPGGKRRIDQIFALGDEEPELVAPATVSKLANELQCLVLR
jgi:hypothetical protein